ncbi:two-component system, OmpR family, sensor histidine kinase KdpD [Paenibacillus catalpae]|uniref:Two-component system, OmpR family, sensor histidine kinase KdpD n=1 Tax=Paenibacillus catalpae TaxID=1045775 RepID=A0A1I2GU07_9BACL|nr:histidine kinase [Paenibacillus catalpae]SFF20529.1 two-component system, OmpR family, sensor histidine kinase KdpD [Paenibacillus catalpae]
MDNGYRRKSPEELLQAITKLHHGKLKIYIGAVSGTGKTYHMLRDGRQLKKQGIDVVACAVSTMQRPETMEQLTEIERIPSIHWLKEGIEYKDLDLRAIKARNPEVLLVDRLAHRNRPEADYPSRLDDIKHLLECGISVMTTINVYELDGVCDLAFQLTGIEAEHTVPDDILEFADEVRLIDVTPETLLTRLNEGHLRNAKSPHLLRRDNLGKLRELALRLMAEDVNESLEHHRRNQGLIGPSGASERVLVTVQYHWNGSIHIRRGQQVAKRLNGELLVVSFVRDNDALSKEAAAFKRSIVKLTQKIGADFEELAVPRLHRRLLSQHITEYAMSHGVTRIVLGHSKHTWLQELLHGSIANGILRLAKPIDLFFVADRTDLEGERILPARHHAESQSTYKRLSPDEKKQTTERMKRGTFKVYIGAAPGVGKTYTMLREGNVLLRKGIDVVIGLLETHGRKDTIDQVGDLTSIPKAKIAYKDTLLEEMDVPAIIERFPEVVLIDELAHSNVPGSLNKKRYEDVRSILEAGISVISTVNVQHLESLNDAVEQITGVRVRETVPDSMLRLADEVELIDVSPRALQERMREGKIYAMGKVEQALGAFFQLGNLIALRELALREIADDVDERLESWERTDTLRGPWRRQEVIFVAITDLSQADRLIRRGFRIAFRLKAQWHVMAVHSGKDAAIERRMKELLQLTEQLGGSFVVKQMKHNQYLPAFLLTHANALKSTQFIIGQEKQSWLARIFRPSIVKRILQSGRNMDVMAVSCLPSQEQ